MNALLFNSLKGEELCMKNCSTVTKLFLLLTLSMGVSLPIRSVGAQENSDETAAMRSLQECCDNDIKIKRLCLVHLLAKCIDAEKITAKTICSEHLKSKHACFDELSLNTNLCTNEVDATTANVGTLNVNDVCVAGTLTANNSLICNNDVATMVFANNTTYTLGTPINWDTILDNPGGGASLTPFAHYTAQHSGYYLITMQADIVNLTPASGLPILGTPIADPKIYVNGLVHRELYMPFLPFVNQQRSLLTSLVKLDVGDVVTSVYNVLTIDQTLGFIALAGTVDFVGNGTEEDESIFKIILLSQQCPEAVCDPVTPCSTTPCDTHCTPCCN